MTRDAHEASYARLCRRVEADWRWRTRWRPLLWTVALGAVLASLTWVGGRGCGDMEANAEPAPDAAAFALAARMQAWQPTWRERHPGELAEVATAIVAGCRVTPWPSAERCPDLLGALMFKESTWRVTALGRRGEIGLMQLLPGVATSGETRAAAADPVVNVRLGLTHLRRCAMLCTLAGHSTVEAAVSTYAGLRCRPSRGASLVMRWERELRAGGGR